MVFLFIKAEKNINLVNDDDFTEKEPASKKNKLWKVYKNSSKIIDKM